MPTLYVWTISSLLTVKFLLSDNVTVIFVLIKEALIVVAQRSKENELGEICNSLKINKFTSFVDESEREKRVSSTKLWV